MSPSKRKDVNAKVFNMIIKVCKAKTFIKHISWNCQCKFNIVTCNSNQKQNNETCQSECKNYCTFNKDYSWNPSTCICENGKYLKGIADDP